MNKNFFWMVLAVEEGALGERAANLLSTYRIDLAHRYRRELVGLRNVVSQSDPAYRAFVQFVNSNW